MHLALEAKVGHIGNGIFKIAAIHGFQDSNEPEVHLMNTNPQMIKANSFSQKLENSTQSNSKVHQNFLEMEDSTDRPYNWLDILSQAGQVSIVLLFPFVFAAIIGIAFVSLKPPQQNLSFDTDDRNLNSNLTELDFGENDE